MVTDGELKTWLARRYGWQVLDPRVRDVGFAFHVSDEPDEAFFGPRAADTGGIIVIKRTGAVWQFGSHPSFLPLFHAHDEATFNRTLAETLPGRDPAQPNLVIPRERTLTEDALVDFLAERYGWRVFTGRIRDLGYAFSVSTHPDAYHAGDQSAMTIGNGPLIVIKRTGALWGFGSNPMFQPVYAAPDERSFYAALNAAMPNRDLNQPDGVVPMGTGLTPDALREWLTIRHSFRVFDGRIHDNGWAYLVNPDSDDALLGRASASYGAGPILVVKRTGAVWQFGSNPYQMPLYSARDENDFRRLMGELASYADPDQPNEVVPIR